MLGTGGSRDKLGIFLFLDTFKGEKRILQRIQCKYLCNSLSYHVYPLLLASSLVSGNICPIGIVF